MACICWNICRSSSFPICTQLLFIVQCVIVHDGKRKRLTYPCLYFATFPIVFLCFRHGHSVFAFAFPIVIQVPDVVWLIIYKYLFFI